MRGKKTKSLKAIKWYTSRGYSANKIIAKLKERNLGLRRKTVLNEVRVLKGTKVTVKKRVRSVPKKYRKPKSKIIVSPPPPSQRQFLYRVSLILNDVPVHSKPFRRNYLGFRLQAFSMNKDVLNTHMRVLREILLSQVERFLGYPVTEWWFSDSTYIGKEYAVRIPVSNIYYLNNRWVFRVEKQGRETYSTSGVL